MFRTVRPRSLHLVLALVVVLGVLGALPQVASAITVSGTAMKDERGTTWQGCATLTQNVKLKVVGSAAPVVTTACDPLTGVFSFSGVTIPAVGQTIAVWFAHPTARGVLYTQANSTVADITGLTPTQDRVWIRSEQAADTVSITDVLAWDQTHDGDVPFDDDGWDFTIPSTMELHVDDGVTFTQAPRRMNTGSIHVSPGSTYTPADWNPTTLRAPGEGACDMGPGVMVPMCIEPTGTLTNNNGSIEYEVASGRYAIAPTAAYIVVVNGGAGSLGVLGTGPGQSMTLSHALLVGSNLTSDPWDTDITAPTIRVSMSPGESWTGNSNVALNVSGGFTGEGSIDLPQAAVNLRGDRPKMEFGPSVMSGSGNDSVEGSWSFRSVVMSNSGYDTYDFGTGGSGPTYNIAAADERIVAVASAWEGQFQLIARPVGAGGSSWGIRKFGGNGLIDAAFDDADGTPGDDILVFDSAGADIPTSMVSHGGGILVGGSSNGDFMVRAYLPGWSSTPGTLDTGWFGGTGVYTWSNGGTEQVDALAWTTNRWGTGKLVIAGSSLTANRWDVHVVDSGDWTVDQLTWNGGGQARVGGVCADAGHGGRVFVVGSVNAAGSRNWGARRLDPDLEGWDTFGGAASWTWNPGGTEDMATSCAIVDDRLHIAGTTGTGASDDWRVRGFLGDGTVDTTYASAGIFSAGAAGDDNLYATIADRGVWEGDWWVDSQGPGNIILAGTDGVTGQMVLRRLDHDGQLDASWGTGGVIHGGAGTESARALEWFDEGRLLVGVRDATNGGQSFVRMYDAFGQLQDAVATGTIRVMGWGGLQGGSVHTSEELRLGLAGDAGGVVFDAESADTGLEQDGALFIRSPSVLSAPSSARFVVRNDLNLSGGLIGNTSTLDVLDSAFRTVIDLPATGVQFHNLRIRAATQMIAFDEVDPLRVKGQLYVRGTSCTNLITIRSQVSGNRWDLDLTGGGTVDVQYADIQDSAASAAVTATNSENSGNNSNWTVGGCAAVSLDAPNGMRVAGQFHPQNVSTTSFAFDWFNRGGGANQVDRGDVEVYSSPPTHQQGLWRFDGTMADSSGMGRNLTSNPGISYVTGRHGQAASFTAASNGFDGGDWDLADDLTVDGWMKTDLSTGDAFPDMVYKGAGPTVNYQLTILNATDELFAHVSGAGGSENAEVYYPAASVIDDQWHHIAMTFRDGTLRLFVDGREVGSDRIDAQVPDTDASTMVAGWRWGGELDDWRLSDVAYGPDAIRGFYLTGRPHAEEVWDFDPTDTNGTALTGAPFTNGQRPSVTYAGPALDANGARYWARARWRTTAGSGNPNAWSPWSEPDWFETSQSTTVSLPSGTSLALGGGGVAQLPGVDVVGTTTFQVTTDNAHGYTAYVTGPSDTWGMSDGLGGATHEIPGRGSPSTLQPWAAGTSGYFGLSVLSATGGKDTARWGVGTTTSDLNTLNWGAPWQSQQLLLHNRATYDPAAQSIVSAVRVNAPVTLDPGVYTTTLTFTAVPNV